MLKTNKKLIVPKVNKSKYFPIYQLACQSYHISIYKCISISVFLWKFTLYKNKIYYSRKVMTCRNLHMKRPVSKKWSNEHAIEFDWQAKFVPAWCAWSIKKRATNTPEPTPDPTQDRQRLPVRWWYKTHEPSEGSPSKNVTTTGLELAKAKPNAGY